MAAAACALILLAPLLVVVSVLVKLTMGGPVIFSHSRVGFGGGRFRCFKFRTMVQNAEAVLEEHLSRNPDLRQEWEANQKLVVDPRTTGLGRLLRKSSLDELPQLVNVLRGEMSLIGPRPVTAAELGRYGADAAHYLRARPGLTGLWQVSGRSKLVYARRVALDSAYVQNWSLALDLRILLRTIPALLSPDKTS